MRHPINHVAINHLDSDMIPVILNSTAFAESVVSVHDSMDKVTVSLFNEEDCEMNTCTPVAKFYAHDSDVDREFYLFSVDLLNDLRYNYSPLFTDFMSAYIEDNL